MEKEIENNILYKDFGEKLFQKAIEIHNAIEKLRKAHSGNAKFQKINNALRNLRWEVKHKREWLNDFNKERTDIDEETKQEFIEKLMDVFRENYLKLRLSNLEEDLNNIAKNN